MKDEITMEDVFNDYAKKGFKTVKEHCLSDCKNFLGITEKNALKSINFYLTCAYEVGRRNSIKK